MDDIEHFRSRKGMRAGVIGLTLNMILAVSKLFIGTVCNSLIIQADGANNLIDGLSALLTMAGFKLEDNGKDELHPYGHGRAEYIVGFLISIMILYTGFSVAKESIVRFFEPQKVIPSILAALILIASILIKLMLACYYKKQNREMDSPALKAMEKDSLYDAATSLLTLSGWIVMPYVRFPLDDILGMLMGAYILVFGILEFRDNLALLLGEGASGDTEGILRAMILKCSEIQSVEQIAVHDYGPEQKMAIAEVTARPGCDRKKLQKAAEEIIRLCRKQLNIELFLYRSL